MRDELTQSDRWIVGDAGIRRQLIENYAEAVRYSADGWIDDILAFSNPWGFDPGDIHIPTMLWHGANDKFSPVGHLRWLAARIPSAIAIVQPGMAHFDAIGVLPDVLRWIAQH
jgi:pimeloyl-ACP methyl ester carboxylesterase